MGDKDVKGADEFSQMLRQAGTGEDVKFTVQRPNMKTPMTMDVKLGGAFQPEFEWKFEMPELPKMSSGKLDFRKITEMVRDLVQARPSVP